jgi:putative tricarboxylic transport membrane protein
MRILGQTNDRNKGVFMNKPLFFLGIFATVLGCLMLFIVIPYQHIPPMMSSVSPDFYPNIGTVILLLGGIGLTVFSLKAKAVGIDRKGLHQALSFSSLMALVFGLTLLAFAYFNFLAGGCFLVITTMWLLGERRPVFLIINTVLTPLVIWLFISVLLGRGLP